MSFTLNGHSDKATAKEIRAEARKFAKATQLTSATMTDAEGSHDLLKDEDETSS